MNLKTRPISEVGERSAFRPNSERPESEDAKRVVSGDEENYILTSEGITIIVVQGSVCDQTDVIACCKFIVAIF